MKKLFIVIVLSLLLILLLHKLKMKFFDMKLATDHIFGVLKTFFLKLKIYFFLKSKQFVSHKEILLRNPKISMKNCKVDPYLSSFNDNLTFLVCKEKIGDSFNIPNISKFSGKCFKIEKHCIQYCVYYCIYYVVISGKEKVFITNQRDFETWIKRAFPIKSERGVLAYVLWKFNKNWRVIFDPRDLKIVKGFPDKDVMEGLLGINITLMNKKIKKWEGTYVKELNGKFLVHLLVEIDKCYPSPAWIEDRHYTIKEMDFIVYENGSVKKLKESILFNCDYRVFSPKPVP